MRCRIIALPTDTARCFPFVGGLLAGFEGNMVLANGFGGVWYVGVGVVSRLGGGWKRVVGVER